MPRPQFTLRALLVAMLVVAAFFGGIRFERERRRREDDAAFSAAQAMLNQKLREIEALQQKIRMASPSSFQEVQQSR